MENLLMPLARPPHYHGLFEDDYSTEKPLRTFVRLFHGQRFRIGLATLLYLVKHSPAWAIPLITAIVIDLISTRGVNAVSGLWAYGLLLTLLLVVNIPINVLQARLLSQSLRSVELRLRAGICRRLQQVLLSYYEHTNAGMLQNKVLRDVESIEQSTRMLLTIALGALLNLMAALITTTIRAPGFLIFFLITVPTAAGLMRMMRGKLTQGNNASRRELEHMSTKVSEMTHLISVTRAHGLEQYALGHINEGFEKVRRTGVSLDQANALFDALSWVTFSFFNAACLMTAAYVYVLQLLPITIGDVVLLTAYFGTLTNSVLMLTNLQPQINKGLEAIRSIGEVLECPDLEQNESKLVVSYVGGEICFEHVSYDYPDRATPAIHDWTLHIQPGETIALVGPSGSGKSTALKLIIGLIRTTRGRILLDGQDLETLDMRTFRRHIAFVPQDSILFDGTVRENITYGMPDIDEARIIAALRDANALTFVQQLPAGLNTLIGEKGMRLSGGQQQRLGIARALIRDPRILFLDEATSSLDSVTEAQLQAALDGLMHGRTTFIAAHRLSTIRNANRIIVIDRGKICEIGHHDELLAQGGLYAQLYAQQVSDEVRGYIET
jgi:ATP-binding cassette, subfamily B, bacterial